MREPNGIKMLTPITDKEPGDMKACSELTGKSVGSNNANIWVCFGSLT